MDSYNHLLRVLCEEYDEVKAALTPLRSVSAMTAAEENRTWHRALLGMQTYQLRVFGNAVCASDELRDKRQQLNNCHGSFRSTVQEDSPELKEAKQAFYAEMARIERESEAAQKLARTKIAWRDQHRETITTRDMRKIQSYLEANDPCKGLTPKLLAGRIGVRVDVIRKFMRKIRTFGFWTFCKSGHYWIINAF